MSQTDELPMIAFASRELWWVWLSENHRSATGIWLQFAKKGSGHVSIDHGEALAVAICHGWIDGQVRSIDEQWWRQRFTPRRRRSKWSQVNCRLALQLIESGEMRPAGLDEVERARADGRWDEAYAPQSTSVVPQDLQRELDLRPQAYEFFRSLDSKNRYAILYRIEDAKRPETRARRIAKFVAMLDAGERVYE